MCSSRRKILSSLQLSGFICILNVGLFPSQVHAATLTELADESLDVILNQEVTSVSRKRQNLFTAPAAVYVITAEEMHRRGVQSLPEALSLAPGLLVAAIDGNKWAISSRGYSGIYSNKLLVQIDGRSIYTPTFSGVYWDQNDIPVQDIERIEVIRGSGASLWGSNAVNGIINVITKNSSDSQGGRFNATVGYHEQRHVSLSYGGKFDEDSSFRVNVKAGRKGENSRLDGLGDAHDQTEKENLSFRLDGTKDNNEWSLQGGYQNTEDQQMLSVLYQPAPAFFQSNYSDEVDSTAWFVNSSWKHYHDNGAETRFQFYIDNYERKEAYLAQDVTTYDLDYQLSLAPQGNHRILGGFGYRWVDAKYDNSYAVGLMPDDQDVSLYSLFLQDEITLIPDRLELTLGSKFEHNDFTGWEVQPNVRLSYTPSVGHFTWAAISKAVRTPSLAENNSAIQGGLTVPFRTWVLGNTEVESENVTSYELGYRFFGSNAYTLDAAVFYSEYDDYLSYEQIALDTFQMGNELSGHSHGLELSAVWQVSARWQLSANYSYLDVNMANEQGGMDPLSTDVLNGSYAKNMLKVYSAFDISPRWTFDAWVSFIDEMPVPSNYALFQNEGVDDYISTNMRLGWSPERDVELSLKALNIFDSQHIEYIGESFSKPTEIERSLTLSLQVAF
ncbi:MAG: TonB-dependent receptor [Neptuniibacter sp.]